MRQKIPFWKSLKFKINSMVTIIFLVIIVFLIFRSNENQKEMIRMKEEQLNQIAVETIDRRFKVSYEILETSLAQITVSPLIIDTIALGDTDTLARLVSQSYEKLKEVGVDEFHFYRPDNSSLLNLYQHKEKEENFVCDRSIVKDINRDPNHLPIKGIEECRHGLFLRYIAPIYRGDEYLGSVELGMEIEDRILNIFKNVSGGEWYLYSLNKKGQSPIEKTSLGDHHPMDLNEELTGNVLKGEIFEVEKSPYIIQMIPISNYKGKHQNYFKRVFDNSELISLQNDYLRMSTIYGIIAYLIGAVLLWLAMTYLLNPLSYLEQKVRKLESGALEGPIIIKSNDEIGFLAGAMENMRQSIYKRESDLKELSFVDPLTNVCNRLCMEYNLKEIKEKGLYPTVLIMADIDGLKQINDQDGHSQGDAHIIKCTEIMKKAMREKDKIFRIGGDEFVLLFPRTDLKSGEVILSRLKKEIEVYNQTLLPHETQVSISFGVGLCEGECESLEQVMAFADQKMYEDKALKKKNAKTSF